MFRVFTADFLEEPEERRIITEWLGHTRRICSERGVELEDARLFHWAPAETSNLANAYNSAAVRHGVPEWEHLPWVDLLNRVVREDPVTGRGAFGFGLKSICNALHAAGLISTRWEDGPADGLGAMVGAWWCHHEARRTGRKMSELGLMAEIEAYNQVDCRVMCELLAFLREER